MKPTPPPPRPAWRGPLFLAIAVLAAAARLAAHPLSVSYARFDAADGALTAVVRVPADDMDLLHQLDTNLDDVVGAPEIEAARDRLAGYVAKHVAVTRDGARVPLAVTAVGPWADSQGQPYVELTLRGAVPAPARPLDLQVTLLRDLYSDHRVLAEAATKAGSRQFVFQGGNTWRVEPGAPSRWATAREFVKLGVEHIVTGYDHVLFLLALLLVAESLRHVVAIVTSFTLAHSVTLALATLGLVEPSGRVVEAVIALSIAYVGVENILARRVRHRWLLTFAFGLVHGFGFAGILREMNLERSGLVLSLLSFNLGVELGQVAIVALLWPLLKALHRSARRPQVVRYASAAIALCGLAWFVERVV